MTVCLLFFALTANFQILGNSTSGVARNLVWGVLFRIFAYKAMFKLEFHKSST